MLTRTLRRISCSLPVAAAFTRPLPAHYAAPPASNNSVGVATCRRAAAPGRWIAASAASGAGEDKAVAPPASSIVARLSADMKAAMKAKDAERLSAIRMLNAAIKQREIELRESSSALTDQEVIKVLQRSVKQRRDSIDSYLAGGRQDLVDKEAKELEVVQSYLPAMLSAPEVEAVVSAVVAELGATSVKDMGKVMAAVKVRTDGRADNKLVSDTVKAKLQPAKK